MTPVELSRTVLRAVRRAVEDGELRVAVPEAASVTVPGAGGCGDYATNIALQLARPAGETPRRVAELLRPHLAEAHGISGVEITGPGFLNISLGSTASTALVEEILRRGPRYGFVDVTAAGTSHDALTGQHASSGPNVPTGKHGSSSPATPAGQPASSSVDALTGQPASASPNVPIRQHAPSGPDAPTCQPVSTSPNVFTRQHASSSPATPAGRPAFSSVDAPTDQPASAGPNASTRQHAPSGPDAPTCQPASAGATAPTRHHTPTPQHPPIPYLVQLHAPHDPRALIVMEALARILRSQGSLVRTSCEARPEPEWVEGLGVEVDAYGTPAAPAPLSVNVRPVPVSDTAELLALGRDAARWALLHSAAHDRPRLTADLLVQGEGNPLFRVRYAYARTRAVSRNAADLGFTAQPGDVQDAQQDVHEDATPLTSADDATRLLARAAAHRTPDLLARHLTSADDAATLLAHLADHPRLLTRAAAHRTPDLLARHLVAVADAALPFLAAVLPLGDEKPLAAHRARLALAEAAGAVLAGGLSLLGIDAPEHL